MGKPPQNYCRALKFWLESCPKPLKFGVKSPQITPNPPNFGEGGHRGFSLHFLTPQFSAFQPRKSPKWRLPAGPLPQPPKIIKKEDEEEMGVVKTEKDTPLPQQAPPISTQAPPILSQAPPPPVQATPPPVQVMVAQATPPVEATPPLLMTTPPSELHPLRRTRKRPPLEPPQEGAVA